MNIRFFKYNLSRQIFLYGFILLCVLAAYDAWHKGSYLGIIVFLCITGFLVIVLIYQYLSLIIIDEKGITYHSILKKYCLSWNEIGQIRVIRRWNGVTVWIIILKSQDPAEIRKKKNAFNRTGKCITCAFSSKMVTAINKFWTKTLY